MSKVVLREGIVYSGAQAWARVHQEWLRRQRFESPALQMTFDSDFDAVLTVAARRDRRDDAIAAMAASSEFTPLLRRLGCPRGIGDWSRFAGNSIGSFVGLVPTEDSSGQSRVQGSITKTGNTHARRLLIETAWHHRPHYVGGKIMRDWWELASPAPRAPGDAGNQRLDQRWSGSTTDANSRWSPTRLSARELAAGAGP